MIDDVVEINPESEAVGDADHAGQFIARAVAGGDGAALVDVAEIEWIPHIVADGKAAAGLGRRREPQAGVAGLGNFGNLRSHLVPGKVEQLKHGLGARGARRGGERSQRQQENKRTSGGGRVARG